MTKTKVKKMKLVDVTFSKDVSVTASIKLEVPADWSKDDLGNYISAHDKSFLADWYSWELEEPIQDDCDICFFSEDSENKKYQRLSKHDKSLHRIRHFIETIGDDGGTYPVDAPGKLQIVG